MFLPDTTYRLSRRKAEGCDTNGRTIEEVVFIKPGWMNEGKKKGEMNSALETILRSSLNVTK